MNTTLQLHVRCFNKTKTHQNLQNNSLLAHMSYLEAFILKAHSSTLLSTYVVLHFSFSAVS